MTAHIQIVKAQVLRPQRVARVSQALEILPVQHVR